MGVLLRLLGLLALGLCLSFGGCVNQGSQPDSLGGVGEILVVGDPALWNGDLGVLLRKTLSSEQIGLPQAEPWFKLIPVQDLGANKFQKRHRLIFHWVAADNFSELPHEIQKEAKLALSRQNVYTRCVLNSQAYPQREVWLVAKNVEFLKSYLLSNKSSLLQYFLDLDQQLILGRLDRLNQADSLVSMIQDSVGIPLKTLPGDYRLKVLRQSFAWISKEIPGGSMNIVLWKNKMGSQSLQGAEAVQRDRDTVLARCIPGPTEGSYYLTEYLMPPLSIFKANTGWHVRGLWKIEGDFMGGPFVHRSWLREGVAYHAEAFVYAPNEPKRAWLRELEALLTSMVSVESSK